MEMRSAFVGGVAPSAAQAVAPEAVAKSAAKHPTDRPAYPTPPGIEMSERFPGYVKPVAEEEVYSWSAPSRPFKKHTKRYYTTIGMIVILLSLILFFAGQVLPILVVMSIAFLAYIMSTIPPHQMVYRLTTHGVRLDDQVYYWEELGRFWFDKKYDQPMVLIECVRFPNRLTLMLGETPRREVQEILSEVLLNQKPPLTTYDKAAAWLAKTFPLELE